MHQPNIGVTLWKKHALFVENGVADRHGLGLSQRYVAFFVIVVSGKFQSSD
jgi:hypothetical protein